MMKRRILSILIGAALTGSPLNPAFSQPAKSAAGSVNVSDGVVKIGILTDLSGLYSDLAGAGSVLAAKMAIEDFQAAEKGKAFAIELVSPDHQNKREVASNKAREWYESDHVELS